MKWEPAAYELFVDLLVKEAENGNRPDGGHYLKGARSKIRETINQAMGTNYTNDQIDNRWDITRKSWKVWCPLVASPEMKWDPVTRTFGATDEDWKRYIKKNPTAAPFRKKAIACEEKLAFVFKGIIEPGKPFVSKGKRGQPHTGGQNGEEDDYYDDDEPSPFRRRFNGEGSGESYFKEIPICTPAEAKRMLEAPLGRHKPVVNLYSIGECMDRLDEIKELERGGKLYLFALDLFLEDENRMEFLQLKDSTLRMAWLLKHQAGDSAA